MIPADKAFYEAGKDLKEEGRLSEAFVFLNHYLDLCEAIEEGEGQLVDHSDLAQTDCPSNIPLPSHLYLSEDVKEHDTIREWILAISMDQKVEQVLNLSNIIIKCLNYLFCRLYPLMIVIYTKVRYNQVNLRV